MLTEIKDLQDKENSAIAQLVISQIPIIITSNYKGIIITQPVRILSVTSGRVIVQAPDPTLRFALKDRIQFYSPLFREIISARMTTVNTASGKLEMADLSFTGQNWNERQFDRVQPQDPIYVNVEYQKAPIRASLHDLSIRGMSLMIYNHTGKAVPIDQNSTVRLSLQLPGDDVRLDLKGKVVHERQAERLGIIGVQLVASVAQEKHINRYVVVRKAEIMAELEQTFRESCDQQSMTWNYF